MAQWPASSCVNITVVGSGYVGLMVGLSNGIMNDVLNFSRIEAGQVSYDIHPVVIRAVVEAVAPMVELQAREKGLELVIPRGSSQLVARADRAKVEQIVLNLLSNAVKFTDAGGTVEMTCGTEADHVWLSVRDTGTGIQEDHLESIFAPFVQVGRSLGPKEGTGLGLAISRDLARAMNGELGVQSAEGVGSTFTLTLPGG